MKRTKRFIALLLIVTTLTMALPMSFIVAFAEDILKDEFVISNDYIKVSMKKDGSSYGIGTVKGHPLKKYDQDQPLLYDKDDKFSTSYTTIRIIKGDDTSDYVFGSSKGVITEGPKIIQLDNNEERAISTTWKVDGVSIKQDLIINSNTATIKAGYANIRYSYTNENPTPVAVGVRILLDTKIAENDGGSFFKNGGSSPISTETCFKGKDVPEWYSIADNTYFSTTNAFGLLKNQQMRRPDEVQMAHWYNLANTLWEFTPNNTLDFSDSYNQYMFADSAIALIYNPTLVVNGGQGMVDTLYGIGDLSGTDIMYDNFIVNVSQKRELKVNSNKTGYQNDGEVLLYLSVDNSDKDSRKLKDVKVKLVFEDKIVDEMGQIKQEPSIWVPSQNSEDEIIYLGDIDAGQIKSNIPIKLKARPIYVNLEGDQKYVPTDGYSPSPITTRKITFEVHDNDSKMPTIASKIVCMPSLGEKKPDIGFTDVNPVYVYYEGTAFVAVNGYGKNFDVLRDKSLWHAYLTNVVTKEVINIDSFDCTVDTINKQLGLAFDLKGRVGEYELSIKYKYSLSDSLQVFTFKDASKHIIGSADPKYKNRGYGICVIARKDGKTYETRLFVQDEKGTPEAQFAAYKKEGWEILIESRGIFKVEYKQGKDSESDDSKRGYVISTDGEKTNPSIIGFQTVPGTDPAKVNRIMYYKSSEPLRMLAEFDGDGKPTVMKLEGNGDLSIINASTIWKHKFQIRMPLGTVYSYEDGMGAFTPKLELLGSGYLLQNIGGLIFDLNYGELGCDDGNYTINFGGKVAIPLGKPNVEGDTKDNPSGSGHTGTGDPPSPSAGGGSGSGGSGGSGGPGDSGGSGGAGGSSSEDSKSSLMKDGNSVTNRAGAFKDSGQFSVSIDSVLYGEHEDKDNPEVKKAGFIGVAVTVELEVPSWAMPGGGKQDDSNSTVTKGTEAANPSKPAGSSSPTSAEGQKEKAAEGAAKKSGGPLSAFKLGLTFNTYDFYAGADLGFSVGTITTGFRIGFAEMNSGKVCLDTMYLEIVGFSIDVVPGVLGIFGLGGGFSGLAQTIDFDSSEGGRPPLTIYVMIAADIVKTMYLRGDLAVSANSFNLSIKGAPKELEMFKFQGDMILDWTTGITFQLVATLDFFKGVVIGQISLAFTNVPRWFFMGKVIGSLNIPGLGQLANVVLIVTSEYLAGGAKILIFSGGIIYYYSGSKVRFLSGNEIDELEAIEIKGLDEMKEGKSEKSAKGTMRFLEVRQVTDPKTGEIGYIGLGSGARAVSTSLMKYKNNYQAGLLYVPMRSENSFDFNIDNSYKGDKDVVLKIYYDGDTAPNLEIKNPNGEAYTLVPYDYSKTQEENNIAGANKLPGERENSETGMKEKYVYVTIPRDKLTKGKWNVVSDIPVSYTLLTVPTTSPTLSNIAASKNVDGSINVSWNAVAESDITVSLVPCDDSGKPINTKVYDDNGIPVKDKNGDDLLIDTPGYIIAQKKGNEALSNEVIPEIVPSGKYIVKIDSLLNCTMFVSAYGSDIITFTNPKTLAKPALTAEKIGNGAIKASATVPPNATGVMFDIYIKNGDSEEKVKGFSGYIEDLEGKGEVNAIFRGEANILDSKGNAMGKASIEPGKTYVIKATAIDLKEGSGWHKSDVTASSPITIPIPIPPQANVKITSGDSEEKLTDSGIPYIQTNSNEFLIEYEITNPQEGANDEVSVRILIDNLQYGEALENDAATGYKGYALTDLTDGEHFVDLIFTNRDGDKATITKKLSIDAIPADIKISSPMSGSKFDPKTGVLVGIISDARAKINIYIDDVLVVEGDIVNVSSGAYKKMLPIKNPRYSHTVKIKATDMNGNSTEHIATIINKDVDDIEGIKLKAQKVAGSSSLQLNAVALDGNNNELLAVPKEKLKWTLAANDSRTSLIVKEGNSCAVVTPGYERSDYAVTAEWSIAPGYSFKDIYVSNIVGEEGKKDPDPQDKEKEKDSDRSTTVSLITYPDNINELIRKLKANMSPNVKIEAFKMYAHVDSRSQLLGNIIYVPGNLIPFENYLVMGVDGDASYYRKTLGENNKIISNVIEFITEKELKSFTLALPFDKSIETEDSDLGLYRYINYLNKWLYMGGDINKTQGIARLTTKYPGRYAVLKNANYKSFADMPGRWSEVYVNGLGSAELVNGMYENNSLVFKPGKNTTRGEFVKMLVAAKGLHIGDIDVSMFADSKKFADWQIPYAAAAAKAGWLKGAKISNGVEARLNDLITREDAMVLVYRAFFAPNIAQKPNSFLDSKDVAAYAKNEVEYLTSIGVVNGYLDNTLKPKNLIAREEVAKIIYECILISDAFGAK